jgi:orotate phosphoribosyltransferase
MQQEFLNLLSAREGHFRYESGYHSNLWLDLDLLFLRPNLIRPFVAELAKKVAHYQVAAVCGPLVGGALLAQMVAAELDVEFYYTERFVRPQTDSLYPVEYRLPAGLRRPIHGKDVLILDDVISAGSAVRGTLDDLQTCGIRSVVIGALLVLGSSSPNFFAERNIPLESIAAQPSHLWLPSECPLCQAQMPLEDVTADSNRFPPINVKRDE